MSRSLLLPLAGALLQAPFALAGQSDSGLTDFHQAGFPTMMLLGGLSIVGMGIYFGLRRSGDDWKGSGSSLPMSFMILNLLNAIIGVFLLFGPGEPGPRVNALGFQLLVLTSVGFYTAYTNLKAAAMAWFVLAIATVLGLMGLAPLLNYGTPLYSLEQNHCYSYFRTQDADFNRCQDYGYLQLLRTFGMFAVVFLVVQLGQLFTTVTDGEVMGGGGAMAAGETQRSSLLAGFGAQSAGKYTAPQLSYEGTAAQQQAHAHPQAPHAQQSMPVAAPYVPAGVVGVLPSENQGGASAYQSL